MGKKRKFLSQEEIWDDSALIESWDEALAEYKLYHSIHARGERVQDVLHAAQASDDLMTIDHPSLAHEVASQPKNRPADGSLEDGELEGFNECNPKLDDPEPATQTTPSAQPQDMLRPSTTNDTSTTLNAINIPRGLVSASFGDEALKDLMMSWYWAGYYTGYYEGQKTTKGLAENSQEGQK